MPPGKLSAIAPVLLVRNVAASADYWRDKLGFAPQLFGHGLPHFAICRRDGVSVMLALAPPHATLTPNWRILDKCNQAYIWVEEVDALYAEMIERGATIDFTLYNTPWGTREFGVQDLDDHDIAFGQIL